MKRDRPFTNLQVQSFDDFDYVVTPVFSDVAQRKRNSCVGLKNRAKVLLAI
jgi:hypothetical protein